MPNRKKNFFFHKGQSCSRTQEWNASGSCKVNDGTLTGIKHKTFSNQKKRNRREGRFLQVRARFFL